MSTKENVMKTKRFIAVSLLLIVLLVAGLTGFSSAAAENRTKLDVLLDLPAAVQIAEQVVPLDLGEPGQVTLLDAEVFLFESTSTGQVYRIYVAVPPGYDPASKKGYPVVYSLDANWHFPIDAYGFRSLLMGGELKEVIIVGIGYDTDDDNEVAQLRAQDMLPGLNGPAFLEFIQEELIPEIEGNYNADPKDRTLAGHSYGGLFTLYALFHATDTFQRYLAMSPALWYGFDEYERVVFAYEEAYAAENKKLPVELFLSVGELEPEEQYGGLWMVSNLIEFNEVLEGRNYKGLELEMVIVEALGHAGCYPSAFTRGLVEVFFP
jgi:predicted alpha/beta superfamily hydrolase